MFILVTSARVGLPVKLTVTNCHSLIGLLLFIFNEFTNSSELLYFFASSASHFNSSGTFLPIPKLFQISDGLIIHFLFLERLSGFTFVGLIIGLGVTSLVLLIELELREILGDITFLPLLVDKVFIFVINSSGIVFAHLLSIKLFTIFVSDGVSLLSILAAPVFRNVLHAKPHITAPFNTPYGSPE